MVISTALINFHILHEHHTKAATDPRILFSNLIDLSLQTQRVDFTNYIYLFAFAQTILFRSVNRPLFIGYGYSVVIL